MPEISAQAPSPELAEPVHRRLIDSGLMQYEASAAGLAERYGRGETSHTIHVWWARRPHSAMRALIFASLVRQGSSSKLDLFTQLGRSANVPGEVLQAARRAVADEYEAPPKMLDMFAGGGTIPLEALRLGIDTYALDSNELATFINRCNLTWAAGQNKADLRQLLGHTGEAVLAELAVKTAPLFPLRKTEVAGHEGAETTTTYLWTYSTRCRECGFRFLLSKRPWLSRKKGMLLVRSCSSPRRTRARRDRARCAPAVH